MSQENQNVNPITAGLGWLDTILKTIKKYGIMEIIKAMLTLMLLSLTIRICIDPSFLFEMYQNWYRENHNVELVERSEQDSLLKEQFELWVHKYHADRIFLIQYHNGTKDWQHGTMRFEKCVNAVSIKEDYVDFNLTWLDMPYYLKENETFIGSIEDLKLIDPVLHGQLAPFGVDYMAFIVVRDESGEDQGIFGCTWPKNEIDMALKANKIHDYLIEDRIKVRSLTK